MRKIKSIPFHLLLFTLCSIFVVSCSEDNPVTPPPAEPYQYDSARFNWKVDTLFGDGFIAGLWAPDTNEMFIPNAFTNTLVRIKNGIKTFTQYTEERPVGAVYGDENNIGYRIGSILINTLSQPLFQRWNGNDFVDIPNPQNLDRNFYFWTAIVKNNTEIWIGLTDGSIVNFNGTDLIVYPLNNPDIVITKFFYDDNNILKFLAYDPHYEKDYTEYLVYEFRNNKWEITYRNNVNSISGPIRYDLVGKKIAPVGLFQIYELVDSQAVPRVNVPVTIPYALLAGTDYSNILMPASQRLQGCFASLFHWNGKKWSLELCGYSVYDADAQYTNENVFYVITYGEAARETYIMRGIKKTNLKILKNKL